MIKVRQIKIPISLDNAESLLKAIANKLNISTPDIISYKISKKSLDARKKPDIFYIYEVICEIKKENNILNNQKSMDIIPWVEEKYTYPVMGLMPINNRIVIVGSGPTGLFASYILAALGYKPLIIERGKMVDERIKDVENFWQHGKLNLESNVQFGEGGAGTFSDGKLNTLIKDPRHLGKKVMEIFIENGAPAEIDYIYNPHIGTDKLTNIIKNMRNKIIKMGGEFRFNTKLTDLIIEDNKLKGIIVNNEEKINCDALILGIGHSARDTIKMLYDNNLQMAPKPFAVGIRIMHEQEMINKSQYGESYKLLDNASYKLTHTTKDGRGVYSFCMCPGGYVVNASSEKRALAINGMSNYARNSKNANSAIVVMASSKDYGEHVLDGIKYQEYLENLAYTLGKGKIPLQLWQDFVENKKSTSLGNLKPEIKGDYVLTNIREALPEYIRSSLLEAIPYFGRKIKGFDKPDTILAIIESRTSSPIRILRDEKMEANIKGIYPGGEGAGYAGGITTCAIDGIKIAEEIIKKYHRW